MSEETQTVLPDRVLDFLSDFDAVKFAQGFVKTYGLKDDDVSRVMNLAEDVVYGEVAVDTLPAEMVSRFSIDQTKSKQAALELAEARLLPVQEVLPGVVQQIRAWGGEVALSTKPEAAAMTPEVFVQTSLQDVIKEMPSHLQGRLAHILGLYVSKHSDKALVMDMLTRSEKVGGVEFGAEDAEGLLSFVDEKMKGKNIAVEQSVLEEKKIEAPKKIELMETPKVVVAPKIVESVPVVKEVPVAIAPKDVPPVRNEVEDAHEVAQVASAKQTAMETPKHEPMTIEEMVGQVCALEPMKLPDGTLVDRCKQIVESRLREVRNASDTQKQIERSIEAGGLGVSGRKLADMMQSIEHAFDALQQHASEKVAQEKSVYLEKQQSQEIEKQTLAEKEEKMMTKRYVELTGKMPDAHVSPAAPSNARVSGSVSKDAAMEQRAQNIDTAKVRSVIEATKKAKDHPQPLLVKEGGLQRPSVQDVKFVKRLSGPIDELRSVSLVDFRRMAKSPGLATEKMMSLVQLVEDQGYDKRVEAIRAWQSSPLYQQYLAIARSAMQEGKPLEDMRAQLAKLGDTLTKEELAAILQLNGELRF
ncbi:MAG: hypothetical protein NTX72_05260 [Candidatus Uhrbacteria bacterium]|nr:hypothetical protein [Candidatus Uhrbacteria bacterium]